MSYCEDYIDPFPRECDHGVPDGIRCGECAAEMEGYEHCSHGATNPCDECKATRISLMLAMRKKLDPEAPDAVVFPDPPSKGDLCSHGFPYPCSLCGTGASRPEPEILIEHEVATPKRQMQHLLANHEAMAGLSPWMVLRLIATIEGRAVDGAANELDEILFRWLTEFRQRRQKISDDAVKNLGNPDKDTPKWMDVDHLLRIIDAAEKRLLFASDIGRNQQHRINELERVMGLLLRYVDHQRGCTSYTNGPCTCGFESAMRDPAIAYDNSRRQ